MVFGYVNGTHHEFQLYSAISRQPDNGFGICRREVHRCLFDALFELWGLLAISCQRFVQFMLRNMPYCPFSIFTLRFECTQHQRAGNEIVSPVGSRNDILLVKIVIDNLYPRPVGVDAIDHLSVQRVPHIKFISTSALSFLYFKNPPLEWSSKSRHKSPYICSKES